MNVVITGAHGQDGTLLRGLLASQGHRLLGIVRTRDTRVSSGAPGTIAADLCDVAAMSRVIVDFEPDQWYHLAACHHSSEQSGDSNTDGEMVRTNFLAVEILLSLLLKLRPQCRLLVTGSSQMYSRVPGRRIVVNEETLMAPATFYGQTKMWSRELLYHYRSRRGLFASMAILFNHESVLRPPGFLSRKITQAVAQIAGGKQTDLVIQDVNAEVDWSSARDVVNGMRLMLAADQPADYVLASGQSRRVADMLQIAFSHAGLDWRNHIHSKTPKSSMSAGVLVGDPQKAERDLGWQRRDSFEDLLREMVAHDRQIMLAQGKPDIPET
jgi:GDPmannose 4,6-dehydratase